MPISLNLHRYAPELSRINFYHKRTLARELARQRKAGDFPIYPAPAFSMPAKGADTIARARTVLRGLWGFPRHFVPNPHKHVTITVTYPDGHKCKALDRVISGYVYGYREALAARDYYVRKAPGASVTIRMGLPRDCSTTNPLCKPGGIFCPIKRDTDAAERWRNLP